MVSFTNEQNQTILLSSQNYEFPDFTGTEKYTLNENKKAAQNFVLCPTKKSLKKLFLIYLKNKVHSLRAYQNIAIIYFALY